MVERGEYDRVNFLEMGLSTTFLEIQWPVDESIDDVDFLEGLTHDLNKKISNFIFPVPYIVNMVILNDFTKFKRQILSHKQETEVNFLVL